MSQEKTKEPSGITVGELIQSLKACPWNSRVVISEGDAIMMEIIGVYTAFDTAYLDVKFLDDDEPLDDDAEREAIQQDAARPTYMLPKKEAPAGEIEIEEGDVQRGLGSAYQSLFDRRT